MPSHFLEVFFFKRQHFLDHLLASLYRKGGSPGALSDSDGCMYVCVCGWCPSMWKALFFQMKYVEGLDEAIKELENDPWKM